MYLMYFSNFFYIILKDTKLFGYWSAVTISGPLGTKMRCKITEENKRVRSLLIIFCTVILMF